ncbi:MAG: hypothetical protein H7240_07070 [Glaciimonas sp.]|nr:hypothetical protein [Glaciimonas sp.]
MLIAALKSSPIGISIGKKTTTHYIFENYIGARDVNAEQSPVIADNVAYVVDSYHGTVHAVDLSKDTKNATAAIWTFQPPELVAPSASISANVSVTVSAAGTVYATAGRYLHALK